MCEGNHRMVALLDSYVDWILLIVNYVSLKDDDDTVCVLYGEQYMKIGRLTQSFSTSVLK